MDYELKPVPGDGIEAALDKAERYRLLNEAQEAESICLDVLEVEPGNQKALTILLLAITDQFSRSVGASIAQARDLLPRIQGDYEQAYYAGIISERWGKAALRRGAPGAGPLAYHHLTQALEHYAAAEKLRPQGSTDARLRWNTCVRILRRHNLRAEADEGVQPFLE